MRKRGPPAAPPTITPYAAPQPPPPPPRAPPSRSGRPGASAVNTANAVALGDLVQYAHVARHASEHRVGAVEMRLRRMGDEELTAAGVGARQGHADGPRLIARLIHFIALHESRPAPPVAARVAVLNHDVGHDAVPARTVEEVPIDEPQERGEGQRCL